MFAKRYVKSVNSSDLRDDLHHHATDALIASAHADLTGDDLVVGSLLIRVKYGDGARKVFEGCPANMAALLRAWTDAVIKKGRSRGWMKPKTEWDVQAAFKLYERVAQMSLAYWLDGLCEPCQGAGVNQDRRTCTCCAGTGRAEIEAGRFESDLVRDMVSELEGVYIAHSARAKSLLRRVA